MNNITPTSFVLEISEEGNIKRKYNDVDIDKFLNTIKRMISEQLEYTSSTTSFNRLTIVKNLKFHIYTE